MSEIVNQNLQKMAKGTGIIFTGTIVGMLLGFVGRVIIVRYTTQSEYGIFSLALVLLNIFAMISTLGLQSGVTRQIAFFRGKKDSEKVSGIVNASIQIALVASIFFSFLLFCLSDIISVEVFHTPELSTPLKIFAVVIPFSVLIVIFTSIFRGFGRVKPNVYFQNILRNVLLLPLLGIVILFGLSFLGIIYAYLASIALTCIAFAAYAAKKLPVSVKGEKNTNAHLLRKELLIFSIPLLAVSILGMIMTWTDTLMLGYFKTPDVVGLYNAALPLANLIPVVLTSMLFLYVPVASQLYSQNLMNEMRRNYAILTKWMFSLTLPIFLIMFLFPETVLNLVFGFRYIQASIALQILALGMFIHTFLGPNVATLITTGKTRFLMCTSLIGAIMNIALNISLIPLLGITGAAIASASSLAMANLLNSTYIYSLFRIHPFTKNYIKPILTSVLLVFIIFTLVKNLVSVIPLWLLPVLFILFLGTYALSTLLTKSFDKEDITMLLAIEARLGVDLTSIKNILKRFI
jgi:O-antigen/teichoic acid export membrane protein